MCRQAKRKQSCGAVLGVLTQSYSRACCAQGGFFKFEDTSSLLCLTLPVTRLLSTTNATRVLVFGLLASLPSFVTLFALLAVRGGGWLLCLGGLWR